ncbi:rna-directed dna polymerase from mobile element jockey-like [Limosa lapponica baueri]|uniref:Rna-directed dna polymerase from mobile element jockey-like n=1 Tax=Limosa lapponica baueri TaxID=1758121 RepID=A0A2I0UHT5_LIMLA|nr:rna-directed dna polymerase from mobile element jockey-like [Limosa lapponica baueri]
MGVSLKQAWLLMLSLLPLKMKEVVRFHCKDKAQMEEGSLQDAKKKGLATWEEYRSTVRVCRDAMRKAKDHLELNLKRDVKGSKKSFFKYISSKRKTKENVGLLLNEVGALAMEDTEKAELLNAFFASVFTAKAGLWESQTLEVRESLEPGRLSLAYGGSGSWRTGEVPEDWRKASVTPAFKKSKKEEPRNYRLVSFTSIPGKVMEQLILDVISKHVEEEKVIKSGQHGFTK